MKNVLLLSDFSNASKNAMAYALQLLKEESCNFYVLHASNFPTFLADDLITSNRLISGIVGVESSEEKLEKIVEMLQADFDTSNHTFNCISKYDYLLKVVKDTIETNNIDLLVMGSNGVTGAQEVLFGSNTINIIRKVQCTSLVIPDHYSYRNLKEVLIPLEEHNSIASDSFVKAKIFLRRYVKRLLFLRISTGCKRNELKDKEHIDHLWSNKKYNYHYLEDMPMHQAISFYVQLNVVDMIVLMVRKEVFINRLLFGSETTKLSNKNLLPLLIFHTN